ncbi:MAG: thioredoxin family protein [Ignavibacteriae bacterium]|nr:thioredoxin family protein [Ignavibacteriota bacterium]
MDILTVVVVAVVLLIILLQIYSVIKSKKSAGKPIPFEKIESTLSEKLKDKKALIYFHSPSCHNCKTLSPIIDKLKKDFDNIESVDISKNLDTAKGFGIMGTPALIFVNNNFVDSVHLGIISEEFITSKLQS